MREVIDICDHFASMKIEAAPGLHVPFDGFISILRQRVDADRLQVDESAFSSSLARESLFSEVRITRVRNKPLSEPIAVAQNPRTLSYLT